ncbi:MAG TPA: periplasmic heavy metal sensor [Verrucomicrobiae bacterium]|nr:periplasmic heavy metal sensor [Verrucomicrobiae bacterium]
MKRSLLILIIAVLAASALFAGSYFMSRRVCESCAAQSTDNLDWLRQEFHLSDADMARMHKLHDGYMPKCAEMCAKIAAKKEELDAALAGATNITEDAKQKLTELALLRSQCQAQMLGHFIEVSQAMPPEQGRRYLAEMQRLTIGAHEQTEQTMSDHHGHMHGGN